MGSCIGSPDSQTKVTLKHLITRLKASAPLQKNKLQRKLQKDEATLIQQFQKPKNQRNKGVEDCFIEQIVFTRNLIGIWGITQNCCTKVIDYYATLQDPNTKNHLKSEIEMLLFLKTIIKKQQLDEIYKMIIRRYEINEPIMVENEMVNYHKKSNSPDEKMRNEYVMNLCTNGCGIQLTRINEVGHNFRYGI